MSHKIPIILEDGSTEWIDGPHSPGERSTGQGVQGILYGTPEGFEKLLKKFIKGKEQTPASPETVQRICESLGCK